MAQPGVPIDVSLLLPNGQVPVSQLVIGVPEIPGYALGTTTRQAGTYAQAVEALRYGGPWQSLVFGPELGLLPTLELMDLVNGPLYPFSPKPHMVLLNWDDPQAVAELRRHWDGEEPASQPAV